MTLSASANEKKSRPVRTVLTYAGVTAFCGLFSFVYEHFSHGVFSPFMVWLFAVPLALGVVPFAALGLIRRLPFPARLPLNLYHSAVATLTVGCCIRGVLEIYGTSSRLTGLYWVVGGTLLALSLICAGLLRVCPGESER